MRIPLVGSLSAFAIVAAMTTAIAVAPAHAQAERDSARASALALNHSARQLYEQGHYAEAAALLREAYRQMPEPVLLYNLARACEKLADYGCAIAAYESYLTASPADRAAVEIRLENCRTQQSAAAALQLPPSPVPPPVPQAAERQSPPPEPRNRRRIAPVVTAIGVAGVGVGLGLVAVALAKNANAVQDPTQQGAAHTHEGADALMRAGNLTLLGGGAAAISGVLWWLVEARSRGAAMASAPPTTSGIRITGSSVALTLHF